MYSRPSLWRRRMRLAVAPSPHIAEAENATEASVKGILANHIVVGAAASKSSMYMSRVGCGGVYTVVSSGRPYLQYNRPTLGPNRSQNSRKSREDRVRCREVCQRRPPCREEVVWRGDPPPRVLINATIRPGDTRSVPGSTLS